MLETILLTGAGGMLGTALSDYLSTEYPVLSVVRKVNKFVEKKNYEEVDLLNKKQLIKVLKKHQPARVIHCAAIVNVDQCEGNVWEANKLHVETTKILAQMLNGWGGHLVYLSTDSVFDGKKEGAYTEKDKTNPLNKYAKTKLDGEFAALECERNTIIRTNIFGWCQADKLSFSEWVIKSLVEQKTLNMFADVFFTPIHVTHLAKVLFEIIDKNIYGLYNIGGSEVVSKYDFAIKLANIFDLPAGGIIKSTIEECDLKAMRPKNMALISSKIEHELGMQMPSLEEGINLLKDQYHSGWVEKIKSRKIGPEYNFWEKKYDEV
jgi:dTDP-4-dehydrorhamnose reductase